MSKALQVPRALEEGRNSFAHWRATKKTRKIPDPLWALAVKLAKRFGVCCTAKVLNLDYNGLKSRTTEASVSKPKANFVELPITSITSSSFKIDMTYPDGTQLHVDMQSPSPQQMASLSALIWRA